MIVELVKVEIVSSYIGSCNNELYILPNLSPSLVELAFFFRIAHTRGRGGGREGKNGLAKLDRLLFSRGMVHMEIISSLNLTTL